MGELNPVDFGEERLAVSWGSAAWRRWREHRERYGRLVRWVGMLVAAVLVSGCAPAGGGRSAEPISLPPRPQELRVDGVDPCGLLTDPQRAELGLDPRADPFVDDSRLYGGPVPSCLFQARSPRATTVSTRVVTTVGIERYLNSDVEAELRPATVEGYPVLVALPWSASDYCSAVIDVAPNQLVAVLYRDVALPPPIPQDELCADAVSVAGAVVRTLARS